MRKLIDSYRGSKVYRKITRKKSDTFFLLLADDDDELNYYAISHAGEFAEMKNFDNLEIICAADVSGKINNLNKKPYKINLLTLKEMDELVSYALLKTSVMGRTVINNLRLVSLNLNPEAKMLCEIGFFDKEYITWSRMIFQGEYADFKKAKPYVNE